MVTKLLKWKKFDNEMNIRAAEKWEKDPKHNMDPHYRWTDANREGGRTVGSGRVATVID